MRARVWLTNLMLVSFAVACGDQPTEVVPERGGEVQGVGTVALATASTEDGLVITTDKDDYAPGDTVWFTGSGWPANDVLDIQLIDDPLTHPAHTWTIPVTEDGTFRDSTYVVDEGDFGVTFTLTATSTVNPGLTLTVQFTDGNLSLTAPTTSSGFQSVPFSPPVSTNLGFTAAVSATPANQPPPNGTHTNVSVRIRSAGNLNPTPPAIWRTLVIGSLGNSQSGSVSWDGKDGSNVNVPEGLYGARVFSSQSNEPNGANVQVVVDRTAPTISNPAVSPNSVVSGSNTAVTLTATATDPNVSGVATNHYKVLSARYQLDGSPASGTVMSAGDAAFDEQVEDLTATISAGTVAALEVGNYLVCVRATDAAGNAGPFTITGDLNCATLEITSADADAPEIQCTPPDNTIWYADDVSVPCTASDEGSGLQNPADASFSLTTSVAAGTEPDNALTDTKQVCDTKGNCATAGPYTFMVDKKAPEFTCGAADGQWHATDVSIACTAEDNGSGLATGSPFNLTTSVPDDTEDPNASTGTQAVTDNVGNSTTAGPIAGNKVDKKDPHVSCGAADGQWHAQDVSIACTASDGGSGLVDPADANFNLNTSVSNGTETSNASTNSHNVADAVGNTATAGPISGNKVDKKGPVVTLVCPVSPVILGSTAHATWTASDGGSGVASGYDFGSVLLNTGSVGSKTASAGLGTSVDNVANNSPATSCNYSVIYLWTGFFQPVDNVNLNVAKAGSAIPVKFNLNGYQGLLIFSNGYPNSSKVNCAAIDEDLDPIEETVTAGNSSLTYDFTANQYVYVWKSDKAWAGTCRRLDVKLDDGTTHSAYFKWMK